MQYDRGHLRRAGDASSKHMNRERKGHPKRISQALGLWILMSVAFTGLAAPAVTVTYWSKGVAYFSVAIPDDWLINTGFEVPQAEMPPNTTPAPRMVTAIPDTDLDLWIGIWVPERVSTIDEADTYMASLRPYLLEKPTRGEVVDRRINGMPVRVIHGTGLREGEPLDFSAVLFQVNDATIGMAVYIGRPDARTEYRDDLEMMIESLRRIDS